MTTAVFTPYTDEELRTLDADIDLNSASLRLLQFAIRAELPPGTKLVAMMLCCHHNNQVGAAWPSPDRLAKLCGMHRRTIVDHLAKLKNMGLALVGKIPGVRTPGYALQEKALQAIAIDGIKWSKNMLGSAEFMQPPAAPSMVNPAKNAGITIQGTEGTEDLKELGGTGGTDARATPATPAPGPVNAADALPVLPCPVPFALPESSAALVALIDQVNAQRANNGKKPFVLADLQQLRTEAAKAGISAEDAAKWILERSGRNFFKADYFAPPAPPAAPTAPATPAAPVQPPAPPVKPLSPEEQAQQAADAVAARERARQLVEEMRTAKDAGLEAAHDLLIDIDNLRGPKCWVDIVQDFAAGKPVKVYPLENACGALKINVKALRAQVKARTAAHAA